tara:strand:- start:515 stop:700 length:186 start_codon:yes stop_codon:yes gene_type:complete
MNAEFGKKDDETLVHVERVSCDGGKYGHPKIFLTVNEYEITICPYCSHKFLLAEKINNQNG